MMLKIFDQKFIEYMSNQNILIVGVGGIGCELVKLLLKFNLKSYHLVNLVILVWFRYDWDKQFKQIVPFSERTQGSV